LVAGSVFEGLRSLEKTGARFPNPKARTTKKIINGILESFIGVLLHGLFNRGLFHPDRPITCIRYILSPYAHPYPVTGIWILTQQVLWDDTLKTAGFRDRIPNDIVIGNDPGNPMFGPA
jgi:hypothetical protein